MTEKIQIRQGPSGAFLEGTADNDVPLWDHTLRRWGAGPLSIPAFRNLSNVVYVDNGGTPPATPDGNIESPFATFDDANIANPTTIYVAPGNYLGEGTLSFIPPGGSVIGMGLAGLPVGGFVCPLLPELDLSPPPGAADFFFENVRVLIAGASGNVLTVTFRNCFAIGDTDGAPLYRVEGGSFQGTAPAGGILASDADLLINVGLQTGASFNRFENCTLETGCNFTFSAAGGTVELDCATVASMHAAGSTVTDGGIRVLDGPAIVYEYGASSATDTEFLIPFLNAGPATAFVVSEWMPTSGGARIAHTIQAQIGAAAAADMTLTVHVGATIAALAPTALAVTIPAGLTEASFDLTTSVVDVPAGSYIALQYTSASALAVACKVLVGLS
jgi:hypothetical protein